MGYGILIVIILAYLSICQNQIQNGDFQTYSNKWIKKNLPSLGKQQYNNIIIDGDKKELYGWYDQNHKDIHLRTKIVPQYFHTTTVLDIYQTSKICQKINHLNISNIYIFGFDFLISDQINCGSISIYWNQKKIAQKYTCISWYVYPVTIQMSILQAQNEICIMGKASSNQHGSLVDNITLTIKQQIKCDITGCQVCLNISFCKICTNLYTLTTGICILSSQIIFHCKKYFTNLCYLCEQNYKLVKGKCVIRQTINVTIKQKSNENTNTLQIISNITFHQELFSLNNILESTNILIDNKKQIFLLSLIDGYIVFNIMISEQFLVGEFIKFQFKDILVSNDKSNVFSVRDEKLIPFIYLDDNKKVVIQKLSYTNQVISSSLNTLFTYTKSLWFGSFVFNLLSYFNLAILYNYVVIYKPSFVIKIIQNIFDNLSSPGTLDIANLRDSIQKYFEYEFTQRISQDKEWLNKGFGLSSNFFINNSDTLFLLCLVCFKLIVATLIYRITSWKCLYLRGKYLEIILNEIISLSPFAILSSAITIFQFSIGSISFSGKINIMLNILGFFVFSIVSVFYFCNSMIEIETEQIQSDERQRKKQLLENVFIDHLLIVTIPITIALKQTLAFFTVQSFLVIIKIFIYKKNRQSFDPLQKAEKFISLIIWTCFHICFSMFAIFDYFLKQNYKVESILYYESFLGIVTIIILLLGGLIQTFFTLSFFIRTIFMFIKQKCKFRNTVHDQQTAKGQINNYRKEQTFVKEANIFKQTKLSSENSFIANINNQRQTQQKYIEQDSNQILTHKFKFKKRKGLTFKEKQINQMDQFEINETIQENDSQFKLYAYKFSKRTKIQGLEQRKASITRKARNSKAKTQNKIEFKKMV